MSGTPDNSRCHIYVVRVFDEDSQYITHRDGIKGKKEALAYVQEVLQNFPRAEHFRLYNETLTKTTWMKRPKEHSKLYRPDMEYK